MAETVRFELTVRITAYDRLATCCLRPLGHVSVKSFGQCFDHELFDVEPHLVRYTSAH